MIPATVALLLGGCRVELGPQQGATSVATATPTGEVWVYTSMYQSVIDALTPQLRTALPDVEVLWFQSGSEKVAQRAEAEWEAGGTRACLLLTSDPFWYADLRSRGLLTPHLAPTVLQVDRSLVDPDGYWATARISLMVLGVNERVPVALRPRRLDELAEPRWRDRFALGDPLASGTMFTTLAFLVERGGWSGIEALAHNGMIAAGGNSSVLTRVETGERDVGVLLLENLLAARRKGSPAVAVYPEDGAIVVPGPIALTADCANPTAARAVYDFLLSPAGQQAFVDGDMYAALPTVAPPAGALALDTIAVRPWEPGFLERVRADRSAIKERWLTLVSGGP